MAFSLTVNQETGITVSNAYVRIDSISIRKGAIGNAVVKFFVEPTKAPFESRDFIFLYELDGPNPIKQAYLHLKTLPEFADAVDC